MSRWPWSVLGIAANSDIATIRAAYAAKLKASDIDADPQAFEALRNARDAALESPSQTGGGADEDFDDDIDWELADFDLEPTPERMQLATDQVDPEVRQFNDHHNRLLALLFDDPDEAHDLDEQQRAQAVAEVEAILTHPMLDAVDNIASASDWFATILSESSPRSDFLIQRVSTFFDWESVDEIRRSWSLNLIVGRLAAMRLLEELERPEHRLHRAWKELSRPAVESSRRGWVRQSRVTQLLTLVRNRAPALEAMMDPWRVSMWEEKVSRVATGRLVVFFIIILVQVLRYCGPDESTQPVGDDPTVQTFEQPLTSLDLDLAEPLRDATGGQLQAAELQRGNPALYAMLQTNWDLMRDAHGKRRDFQSKTRMLLGERLEASLAHAPPMLLLDLLQWRLKRAEAQPTAAACGAYFKHGIDDAPVDSEARLVHDKLRARLLLSDDPTLGPGRGDKRVAVDGAVITRIAAKSGFSRDQIVNGMAMKGSPAQWCPARKAFLKGATTLPARDRDPILSVVAN